jgi:hypothetical protein
MLAAAAVIAITGTARPRCRLRVDTISPYPDSTRITSASG